VTTAQIVRTMKRGENGSINVSMGPLEADSAVLFLVGCKPKSATSLIQNPDNLYTISGAPVTDMTADAGEAIESDRERSMRAGPAIPRFLQCSVACKILL
jgi:hypothetical protein